ncbi:hypothetical protein [Agromyces bauzanensis]
MDWTFWVGLVVLVAACAMTAFALAIQRREGQRRGSIAHGDTILDLEGEKEKGLFLSGWVP